MLGAACRHTYILTIVVHHRRNPTNDGIPAASPRPPPPLRSPFPPRRRRALSALSIAHGAVRHASWTSMRRRCPPSRTGAASAAPARASLVGIRAHCASAAVTLRRLAVSPRSLLGPPPTVRQRRWQHDDVDGRPWLQVSKNGNYKKWELARFFYLYYVSC